MLRRAFLNVVGLFTAGVASAKSRSQLIDVTSLESAAVHTVLPDGPLGVAQQEYVPLEGVRVNVGNIEIIGGDCMPAAKGTRIFVDGIEQKRVRRIVLTIGVHDVTTVQIEHVVDAKRT